LLGNPTDRAVLRKAFTASDCACAGSWVKSDAASSAGAGAESGVDSGDDVTARATTMDHLKIDPAQINPSREWRLGFPLRNSHSAFRNRTASSASELEIVNPVYSCPTNQRRY